MRKAQKARWAEIKGTASTTPTPKKKRKFSAQAIANIRVGVARRMAAQAKAIQKPKRELTAAGRARLVALARARRTKVRAAGKSRL